MKCKTCKNKILNPENEICSSCAMKFVDEDGRPVMIYFDKEYNLKGRYLDDMSEYNSTHVFIKKNKIEASILYDELIFKII